MKTIRACQMLLSRILILAMMLPGVGLLQPGMSLAQSSDMPTDDWNARLVGQPLYLRGFWIRDRLRFDGAGLPLSDPAVGPITLSGIDVTKAERKGKQLVISGVRVALVGSGDAAGLKRVRIGSVTRIDFALLPSNKRGIFAAEVIQIIIEPDAHGSFDIAIGHIFANGMPALATIVPVYWQCYADSYLKPVTPAPDAEITVNACVVGTRETGMQASTETAANSAPGLLAEDDPQTRPPRLVSSVPLPFSPLDRRWTGTAIIHLRVTEDGVPVGLQVVRAVGAGVDELLLQSVAQNRYEPASRNGKPVPYNLNLTFALNPEPAPPALHTR